MRSPECDRQVTLGANDATATGTPRADYGCRMGGDQRDAAREYRALLADRTGRPTLAAAGMGLHGGGFA